MQIQAKLVNKSQAVGPPTHPPTHPPHTPPRHTHTHPPSMGRPEPLNTRPSMSRDTGVRSTCRRRQRSATTTTPDVRTAPMCPPRLIPQPCPCSLPRPPPSALRPPPSALRPTPPPTHLPSELQRGALVVDARGALKHLHHRAVAIHLQHLPAPHAAVAQPQVDDLGVLGLLRGVGGGGGAAEGGRGWW